MIAGGLWQISAVSAVTTTYGDVMPGLLLVGLGAGLLLPTATNSVVGSVPQGDSGSDQPPTPWLCRSAARSASP